MHWSLGYAGGAPSSPLALSLDPERGRVQKVCWAVGIKTGCVGPGMVSSFRGRRGIVSGICMT